MGLESSAFRRMAKTEKDEALASLGSTFGNFENRIKRKLKEQEVKDDQSQREAEARHSLMLQAMATIRKALQETCKINLGDRFEFELDVSDWEGWPRVELNLIDAFAPDRIQYGLVVTANDKRERGRVQIGTRQGEVLGFVHLCDAAEYKRLPVCLKKSVRNFLDEVGAYVLDPVAPEDLLEVQSRALDTGEDAFRSKQQDLSSEDMFSDEANIPGGNSVYDESEHNSSGADPIPLAIK